MSRGQGRVYRRKNTKCWWIDYSIRGDVRRFLSLKFRTQWFLCSKHPMRPTGTLSLTRFLLSQMKWQRVSCLGLGRSSSATIAKEYGLRTDTLVSSGTSMAFTQDS